MAMPPELRRRSLLLQAPAVEAGRCGYEVREIRTYYSQREGGVEVGADGFVYVVTVKQNPSSPRIRRALHASLWISITVGSVARAAGATARAGHWRTPWGWCCRRSRHVPWRMPTTSTEPDSEVATVADELSKRRRHP